MGCGVNYYERYVGDFQRDTGHLSCTEIGVYDRLLDHYYATETALPGDLSAVCRIARAMNKQEQAAVRSVVDQFFSLEQDGLYHNTRADAEITKAQTRINTAKANGKKGGRKPKNKPNSNPEETQEKPGGFQSANPSATQPGVHHTPHAKDINPQAAHTVQPSQPPPGPASAPPGVELAVELRKAGVACTASHPRILEWSGKGVTVAQALEAVAVARMRKPENEPIAPNYLNPIIDEILHPKKTVDAWWETEKGTLEKGAEIGVQPRPGEGMNEYRGRVREAAKQVRQAA